MISSLWTDLEALARLARSARAAERESRGARAGQAPIAPLAFAHFSRDDSFEIHAVDAPARMVTGDYHDAFRLGKDTLALVMADVSGKGPPAAILRGVTRSVVRNISSFSPSPGDTLTRVNRILLQADLGSMFLTIFLGRYDLSRGVLRYANAGHPVPFRIDCAGRVSPFGEVTGPLLGVLDLERYAEGEEKVEVGDRLFLYTDGVTEAVSPGGDFFGSARLAALLANHAGEAIGRLCEIVAGAVNRFQDHQRQDDTTLSVFHRRR